MSSFSSSGMHSTGVDRPTPRGSKPTRSNRCSTSTGSRERQADAPRRRRSAPGPPGLTISEPIRSVCPASSARTRNSGQRGALGLVVADRDLGAARTRRPGRDRRRGWSAMSLGKSGRRSRSTGSRRTSGSAGSAGSADVADSSASVSENEVQPGQHKEAETASRLVRTAGRPRCRSHDHEPMSRTAAPADDHPGSGSALPSPVPRRGRSVRAGRAGRTCRTAGRGPAGSA